MMKYVEICKHKEGEIVQKTLWDEVLERYQRAVDYFNERADSAENIIEEAKKRGISGEKLLKHIDEKYFRYFSWNYIFLVSWLWINVW